MLANFYAKKTQVESQQEQIINKILCFMLAYNCYRILNVKYFSRTANIFAQRNKNLPFLKILLNFFCKFCDNVFGGTIHYGWLLKFEITFIMTIASLNNLDSNQ